MLLTLWLIAVFILSVVPISQPKTEMPMDKIEHAIAYGAGAMLFFRALSSRSARFRAAFLAVLSATGYGVFIECVQYFLPHRTFSLADMAANAAGAAIFCLPYALWSKS